MLTSSSSKVCLILAVIACARAPFAAADGWRPGGFDNLPLFDGVRDVVVRQLDLAPMESYGNWDNLAEEVLVCAGALDSFPTQLSVLSTQRMCKCHDEQPIYGGPQITNHKRCTMVINTP